jgi:hypothetical protein
MNTYKAAAYVAQPGPALQPVDLGDSRYITAQEYLHTHTAGALVPLAQAAITGALVAGIACTVLVWQSVPDTLVYTVLTFLGVTLAAWIVLQRHWFSLTAIEKATGLDINGDGVIGEKTKRNHVVSIDLRTIDQGGYQKSVRVDLPVSEQDLAIVAAGIVAGRPFTEREWTGSTNPLSVNQFRDIRDEMIKRGILEPVNPKAPQQGYKFTMAGMHAMKYFAALSPTKPVNVSEIA